MAEAGASRSFLFTPRRSPWRVLLVPALLVAAAAHIPVIGEHLEEAPYMGVLFIVLTAACVVLAAALVSFDSSAVYALAVLTCVLADVGYIATRMIAFPQLADDVGNWMEPLGIVSIVSEFVAAMTAAWVLYRAHVRTVTASAPPAAATW